MPTFRSLRRRTRAERVRLSFSDTGGGFRLPMASRRTTIPGLAVGVAFLIVASMTWRQLASWHSPQFDTLVHGLTGVLRGLALLGLGVGAAALFVLTVALLTFRESAHLAGRQLVHVARLGPAHVFLEYDLDKVHDLRAADRGAERARVVFDYGGGHHGLGDDLPRAEAEARVKVIQGAIERIGARASQAGATGPRPTPRP